MPTAASGRPPAARRTNPVAEEEMGAFALCGIRSQLMRGCGRRRRLPVAIVLALAAACAVGDPGATTSQVTDSAGVSIVTSTGSVWGEGRAHVDSTPVLRIGAEPSGPYQFSFISSALLLEGGGVAVVELSANEIRLFDAEGRHVRSVGRRGRGPGEFQVISGLFRRSDDSLVAYDQIERRLTVWPLAGGEPRVVRSQPVPRVRGSFSAFGTLGDGRLVLYNPGSGFRPDLAPGLQWDTTDVVVLDPADGTGRTVARLPSRQQWILPGGDTRVLAPAHMAVMAATSDGFYWATSDRYEVRFFDPDGDLRRILRRPVEARRVEPGMIETWITANLDEARRNEGEAAVPRYRRLYEEGAFGDRIPLFDRAFVDGDGRLWIASSRWPEPEAAPRRWSVFAPSGTWLGDLDAPARLRIVDSRDDLVLGIWQAEGDAPYVQVHRLRHP